MKGRGLLKSGLTLIETLIVVAILGILAALPKPACAAAGTHVTEIGVSTPTATFVQIATGAGTLNNVEFSSATAAGDFVTCVDTGNLVGLGVQSDGTAAAPRILNLQATGTNKNDARAAGAPALPFVNGLACAIQIQGGGNHGRAVIQTYTNQ